MSSLSMLSAGLPICLHLPCLTICFAEMGAENSNEKLKLGDTEAVIFSLILKEKSSKYKIQLILWLVT